MTFLFFDTETTGLPDQRRPAGAEGQPHICQLGVIVTDREGRVKAELNALVRPDGWTIPAEVSAIHGITQPDAERYGLSTKGVLSIFARLLQSCERVVAHNIKFDLFMLQIECSRTGVALDLPTGFTCTMESATDLIRLPATQRMIEKGVRGYKRPNLTEAYRHFFGREFEGAHDAMADVRACRDVFFRLKDEGVVAPEIAA